MHGIKCASLCFALPHQEEGAEEGAMDAEGAELAGAPEGEADDDLADLLGFMAEMAEVSHLMSRGSFGFP
jgi:hypothetical protein